MIKRFKHKHVIYFLISINLPLIFYLIYLYKTAPISDINNIHKIKNYDTPSLFYYSDGTIIGSATSPIVRIPINNNKIPKQTINALISTEDQNFYEHEGFDINAIFRASFDNLKSGQVVSGASTITQQLVKNQLLTSDVTFNRKIKEILYSIKIETVYSKSEILQHYLNAVDFGRSSTGKRVFGIEAAANGIFDKKASDLSIAESAFLIGVIQSPSKLTPFTKTGALKTDLSSSINRKNYVLANMLKLKYINKKQYEAALKENIIIKLNDSKHSNYSNFLINEIERRSSEIILYKITKQMGYSYKEVSNNPNLYKKYYSIANKLIKTKGYQVYTTINKDFYSISQTVKESFDLYGPEFIDKTNKINPVEIGAIVIENKSGKILSFIGGRGFESGQINHATQTIRQNGSTMKPLVVYGPAIEEGIVQPGSVIADIPTKFGNWIPKNFNNQYHGLTSIRLALANSYNIPAVKIYSSLPTETREKYLYKLGITTFTPSDYENLSLSLGAGEHGVKLEELTNAFSIFPNEGYFKDAFIISKIINENGKEIFKNDYNQTKVFSKETSYLMNSMLKDVVNYGTAASIKKSLTSNNEWAGKTGTSQNNTDSLFIAYNSEISIGIWMGYDSPKYKLVDKYMGLSSSERTLIFFSKLVNELEASNSKYFPEKITLSKPNNIISYKYCALSGLLTTDLCSKANLTLEDIGRKDSVPTLFDNSLGYVNKKIRLSKNFMERYKVQNPAQVKQLLPDSQAFEKLHYSETD